MKITFIGLGIMGSRMAANLLKNGVDLTVYNRSQEITKLLKESGAHVAKSAKNAVENADIVFSMLSTPEVVADLFFNKDGVLSKMKKNAIWVDCTTVNPSFSRKANETAANLGIRFIDAPVAGTKPHAENAQLTFFVGAEKKLLTEVEPYLKLMGQKIVHIGHTGKGASFNMIVNILLAQSMLMFSEAVLLGGKMATDKDFLLNVLPGLVVSAPFTKFKAEMIRDRNYEVQFPLEWMLKDLHLAAITAYENQQPLYLANLTKEIFAEANKKGMGRLDFAAIHKYLEEK